MDNPAQNPNPVIPPIADENGGFPASGGFGGPPPTAPVVGTTAPSGGPKSRVSGKIIATVFGLLLLVGGIGAGIILVNQQQTLKEKAAGGIQCAGGTCNDGFSFGSDCAAPQSSCGARNQEACASHGGIKSGGGSISCSQPAPTNPPGAPAPFCTGSSSSDRGQCISSWTYIFPGPGCQQSNGSSLGRCCAPGDTSCNPPTGGSGTGTGATASQGQMCANSTTSNVASCGSGLTCSPYKYVGTGLLAGSSCAGGGTGVTQYQCALAASATGFAVTFSDSYWLNSSGLTVCNTDSSLNGLSPTDRCRRFGAWAATCQAPSSGGSAPSGNACSGSCCSAASGFHVRVCTCTGPLTNGACKSGCTNGGASACIPSSFCGSMQLDVVNASDQESGINIARNGQTATCSTGQTPGQPVAPTGTTTPGITAQCTAVAAYDTNWAPLTVAQLSALKPGDKVRFTVAGTTSSGSFDQARFTINGALQAPVTGQRPNSADFFEEYTIPAGVTSFTVTAQIHLPADNNWY
ncbi:MAG TPA: hypothetical protein VLE44_02040 [Candidatus Saccharimonadales bacterium]|nr:hypothetical protein [Candidatus Saccharimonadales bacterium]